MNYNLYKVGSPCIPPGPDGVFFDLTDSGGMLLIRMARPTAEERRAFKQGLSIRFAVVDQIIFLLVRMGRLQWMDAPYYRWLSPHLSQIELPEEGYGLSINAMLADGETGMLQGIKMIGLDTDTSRKLMAAAIVQPKIPDYDARLRQVMLRYSTEELLKEADTLC